jgi:23S rRNA pseudouridine955/2504/2580 synthase
MIRDGKISVMRAKLVKVPAGEIAPAAEPTGIRTWTPRKNMRVEAGDLVVFTEIFLPPRKAECIPAGNETLSAEVLKFMQSLIIYKDERIIILNKPTGLAVHAGPGNNSRHLEGWLAALQFDEPIAPLLVHRLDKGTSGALLLARNRQVASLLAKQIKETGIEPQVEKVYWAMVRGVPPKDRMNGE